MPYKSAKSFIERTVALCYVRRSMVKDAKDMVSPEIQRENIQRICDANGWTPEWYEDTEGHKSGMYEKNRPGWLALKARLSDPDVVALIGNDLSRLHRKGWRIGDLLDFVEQHGIKLILADPSKQIDFSTPHGRMIAQLSAIFDEWYVIDVSIRRKANIAYRKSQNKTVGLPPFGTKRNEEGYLIPSDEGAWFLPDGSRVEGKAGDEPPEEGALWRGYFDCTHQVLLAFAEGKNRSQICDTLTAQGYAFRGRKGKPTLLEVDDVRRITHNWVEYGGIVMDNHAISRRYAELDLSSIHLDPERAVFDITLLEQVGEQLVARSRRRLGKGRRRSRQVYPLSSLVYCAHCEMLAHQHGNSNLRTRLIGGSKQQKYYVHRAGIKCGCGRRQVPRHFLEAEFLNLIRQLTVDADLMDTMLRLAGETSATLGDTTEVEARRTAAIAKCQRRIAAARHLYEDGDITREEYLKRKEQNERELAHWRSYSKETQRMVTEMMMCVDAVGNLSQMWEASSSEDRNRMAHTLFEHIVFDLDTRRIVDFKLKPWMDQFIVLQAAVLEDQAKYGKCDPNGKELEHLSSLNPLLVEFLQCIAFPQNAQFALLETS